MTDAYNKPLRVTQDSTTLRSRFGIVLVVIVWLILGSAFVSMIVGQQWLQIARYAPLFALIGYVLWILLWSPSVTIAPSGVTIRNLLRSHAVSWPAIQRIDTRFALTLYTAAGKIPAWSAPAPSRFAALRASRTDIGRSLPESTYLAGSIRPGDIPQSDSGLAALYVRRYWEQLRDAGYLNSGVVEGTGVVTTWLLQVSLILFGLLLLTLAAFALVPPS
ncbi:MAG TPA: PH domain-containing protein [Galbitalea sp.]|nr:PH domain-containing protein [Galbitalea sp.]